MAYSITATFGLEEVIGADKVIDFTEEQVWSVDSDTVHEITVAAGAVDQQLDLNVSPTIIGQVFLFIKTDQLIQVKLGVNTNPAIEVNSFFLITDSSVLRIFVSVPGAVDATLKLAFGGSV